MKCKGSVTAFLAICIGFFLAAILAFLELARVSCLAANARMNTLQASDSLLAEYQTDLWKDYNVLFWEAGEGEGREALDEACIRQQEFISNNYDYDTAKIRLPIKKKNYYLLNMTLPEVTVNSYELATDYGGAPFRKQAAMAFSDVLIENVTEDAADYMHGNKSGKVSKKELKQIEKNGQKSIGTLEKEIKKSEKELKKSKEARKKAAEKAASGKSPAGKTTVTVSSTSAAVKPESRMDTMQVSAENLAGGIVYVRTSKKKSAAKAKKKASKSPSVRKSAASKAAVKKEKTREQKEAERKEKEAEKKEKEEEKSIRERKEVLKDNPISWMQTQTKKGILTLVLPGENISSAKIDTSELLTHRKPGKGNFGKVSTTAAENLKFQYYLQKKFSCYTSEEANGELEYEQEYLIAGKKSDLQNLKAVVRRLLLMREALNFIYLQTDKQINGTVTAIATSIATICLHPETSEEIKQGILLALAYAESIRDVRTLLNGGTVPLMKRKSDWHSTTSNLSSATTAVVKKGSAKGSKKDKYTGLTYEQYLLILRNLMRIKKVTYRSMDLMESAEGVQMDQMVSRMKCSYQYEAPPVFWSFITLGDKKLGTLSFKEKKLLSYMEKRKKDSG